MFPSLFLFLHLKKYIIEDQYRLLIFKLSKLKKIDEENSSYLEENWEKAEKGKLTIDDILGFKIKSSRVFIPRVPCSYASPSNAKCGFSEEESNNLIFSLTPLYDTLIYPIPNDYEFGKKMTAESFESTNNIKINDFIKFIEKGRIIPYFETSYSDYDVDFINVFLEPGLPRISSEYMNLIYLFNKCESVKNLCKRCEELTDKARGEIKDFNLDISKEEENEYVDYIAELYRLGVPKKRILTLKYPESSLNLSSDVIIARNFQATIETNCSIAKESFGLFSNISEKEGFYDTIVSGLGVKYTSDIDLGNYLDLMDSSSTRAIRKITDRIRKDPYAMRYSERLNSKLVDYNRQIEEIAKSKTAKFYNALSDIVVYGTEKVIEDKTDSTVKTKPSNLRKVSDWIASRFMDVENIARRRDLTLAQLYRTKYKIDECKK